MEKLRAMKRVSAVLEGCAPSRPNLGRKGKRLYERENKIHGRAYWEGKGYLLPSPEELALKDETVEVTIAVK